MSKNNKSNLLEQIHHATWARPFSIHHTFVGEENTNALYLHCHPEAEFLYLEEGEITFLVEGEEYSLKAGDGIFVPPNLVHNANKLPGTACSYCAVVFSVSWLTGYWDREGNLYTDALLTHRYQCISPLRASEDGDEEILRILKGIRGYMGLPINRYELKLLGELMICFQELYNSRFSKLSCRREAEGVRCGIQRSLDYIGEHYREPLTLARIAGHCGYSESHFCRSFKEITGYSPFEYLSRIRVIKASEALLQSDERITDIAMRCGFENISYFNRVFRREMGVAPGVYRENGRKDGGYYENTEF